MGTARSAGLKGLLGWSLLWIVLCSVAAELWMVYCWQPFTHPTETARLTSSWMEFRDCEVMLIGSSLAELGLASPTIAEVVEEQLGRKPCVLNLGQRGLSAESAVSYLRAVLARSTPEVMIWGTSPQECMVQNEGHFLKAFAAPSDVLRASWEGPATVEDAKRVLSAVFRPPALLVQATVFAGSQALGYFLDLAPTRFENEMARIRINGGWHPMSSRRGGSKAAWQGEIQWRSIDALRELLREHGVRLSVLLMPIDEQSVKKEAAIRRKFTLSLADYCRRHEIPYVDLFDAPYRLEKTDYMADGRHIVVHGARKLSGEIARRVVVPMLRADGQQGGQDVGSNVHIQGQNRDASGPD